MIYAENNPIFSVIVPVYQTEQYLSQCIDSILGQSFQNFELILVDDGSKDRSGMICDEYAMSDKRIRVIHKTNGGLVSARKAGASLSIGEYIVNVDSDDYIATDLLFRLSEIITEYSPEIIMYDLIQFSDKNKKPLINHLQPGLYTGEKMEIIRNNLIQNNNGEHVLLYNLCGMAVKRSMYILYQNAVPNIISRGEDLVVSTPLLKSCNVLYLMKYLGYYYRCNPTSIMNTFSITEVNQIKEVTSFMSKSLGEDYQQKIDVYTAMHYFDFLDRGMIHNNYKDYLTLIQNTLDKEIMSRIKRARCKGNLKLKLVMWLMRHRHFSLLWILRNIKKRKMDF